MNKKKGQTMIETLLIIPIILILMMAVIQFGFIMSAKIMTKYAAFTSARYAAVYAALNAPEGYHKVRKFVIRVWWPFHMGFENTLEHPGLGYMESDKKNAKIAAAIPLTAITIGREWGDDAPSSIRPYLVAIGMLHRFNRALKLVDDTIYVKNAMGDNPVAVSEITYHYPLIVPFVNRIIGMLPSVRNDPNTRIDEGKYYLPIHSKSSLLIYYKENK